MNSKTFFVVTGFIVLVIVFLGLFQPAKTTDNVNMVQPCGWPWCAIYDQSYSQVNERNAHANEMNASANKLNAQATQIVSQTKAEQRKEFVDVSAMTFWSGGCLVLAIIVIGGTVILYITSR